MADGQLEALERELAKAKRIRAGGFHSSPGRVKAIEAQIRAHVKAVKEDEAAAEPEVEPEIESTQAEPAAETTEAPRAHRARRK